MELLFRLLAVVVLAMLAGKLASKLKMPAVLGFLVAGMAFGPHALNLLSQEILDHPAYHALISFLECGMGLMLGSEMVWRKIRSYGKQIVVITLAQSLMTFAVVSAAFSMIFYWMDIPVFLGLIFGGIALATAPAPALSIVTEYKTDGPVTKTLIPLLFIGSDNIHVSLYRFRLCGMEQPMGVSCYQNQIAVAIIFHFVIWHFVMAI